MSAACFVVVKNWKQTYNTKNIYFKILLEKLEDSIPNLKMVNLFLERGCGILSFYSKYASYLIRKRVEVKKKWLDGLVHIAK